MQLTGFSTYIVSVCKRKTRRVRRVIERMARHESLCKVLPAPPQPADVADTSELFA